MFSRFFTKVLSILMTGLLFLGGGLVLLSVPKAEIKVTFPGKDKIPLCRKNSAESEFCFIPHRKILDGNLVTKYIVLVNQLLNDICFNEKKMDRYFSKEIKDQIIYLQQKKRDV